MFQKYASHTLGAISVVLVIYALSVIAELETGIDSIQKSVDDLSVRMDAQEVSKLSSQVEENARLAMQRPITNKANTSSPRRLTPKMQQEQLEDLLAPLKELPEATEIHSVGIYEPKKQTVEGGTVHVKISRTGTPVIVTLGAYDYTDWQFEVAEDVDLRAVVLSDQKKQTVKGLPDTVKVITLPHNQAHRVFYSYSVTNFNKDQIEKLIGHKVYSYQGSYKGDSYEINNQFYTKPHLTFSTPKDYKFPSAMTVNIVASDRGKAQSEKMVDKSFPIAGSGMTKVPFQLTTIKIDQNTKPVFLALTASVPMGWKIDNPNNVKIAGVVLSGPTLQYLTNSSDINYPVISKSFDASIYQSGGYKELSTYLKKLTNSEVYSYRKAGDTFEVSVTNEKNFPKPGDLKKQAGIISFPEDSQIWNTSGEYSFSVPKQCNTLHAMAWGAGGAGGSWNSTNMGGGGGFSYDSWDNMSDKSLKVIVGGGGKAGTHRQNDSKPTVGKGGFPDGGNGSMGYDATGGGGGGASRIKIDQKNLLIAGGGGGGCGHGDSMGGGGGGGDAMDAGRHGFRPSHKGGKGGDNGVGGKGGISRQANLSGHSLDESNNPGNVGTNTHGGDGAQAVRKGAGGGGGGYGGGGGGGADFHYPGGGGGGGSLGKITKQGFLMTSQRNTSTNIRAYRSQKVGAPGNAEQAGINGYGGLPRQDGVDGKVIVWCEN